jgi:hypothetical protein
MATDEASNRPAEPPDYSALIILGVLCLVETAMLYVLIAVETPLTPIVEGLLRNGAGVFTLVMFVVTLLCLGMSGFLWCAEWLHKRQSSGKMSS